MLFKVLLAGMCSLCLVGTATLASAHEFIVKPDKTQAAKAWACRRRRRTYS